ncbi:hypothetical protein IQ251_10295 [Saccharopolyspora sp. HNM0983]|uniref:Uncharacterized protein n=1 Tax=Saccharopolyspora montiporae TaxID=2781240 RepID=A0A929B7T5_9PSEU|nr:hypothetical protein [Saccharopolyspora sp. HNM0983]
MALGRTKIGRRQQTAQPDTEPAEPDHELESYLAALAPEESVETTGSGRRFGNSDVYQLRLPLMANERLKELAAKQGTSPAALARDWVLQHLSEEPDPAPAGYGSAGSQVTEEPAWPSQDTQRTLTTSHARPDQQHTGMLDRGLFDEPQDVERTDEITVPHKRMQR